jgi:hypothetical protein
MIPRADWNLINQSAIEEFGVETKNPCEATQIAVIRIRIPKTLEDRFLLPMNMTKSRLAIRIAVIQMRSAYIVTSMIIIISVIY